MTSMRRSGAKDVVGAFGVLGVVLPVIGLLVVPIWTFPGTDDPAEALLAWTAHHQGRLQVLMVLNAGGVTLWLAFAAGLRTRMRVALPATSTLPDLFGAGMAVMVSLLLAGFTAFDVLVYRADDLTGSAARVLYDVTFGLLAMSGMPAAVALAAFAVAARSYRFVPGPLGVLAAVTAVAHVLLPASLIIPRGVLSLEEWPITVVPALLFAWILVTGIVFLRAGAGARATARPR
jgi:hypothetical protein